MKAKVGDKIKIATIEHTGEGEVTEVYKDKFFGYDMIKVRQKADNLGSYNYYEFQNKYNQGWDMDFDTLTKKMKENNMSRRNQNQITIEERIEQLSKWDLELILLRLIDVDKHINIGDKVRREIVKRHDKEILDTFI